MEGDGRSAMPGLVFVSAVSESLKCPIHLGLLDDPVIARCGHTFCKTCITEALSHSHDCPLDNMAVSADALIPNMAVAGQVGDLQVYCHYGLSRVDDWQLQPPNKQWEPSSTGCQERIRLADLEEHLQQCPHRTVACPNSERCGSVRAKDLDDHLERCTNVPCPNGKVGCSFRGTQAEVVEHHNVCKFESMKDVLAHTFGQHEDLRRLIREKDEEIASLKNTVSELSEKLENLASNIETKLGAYEDLFEALEMGVRENRGGLGEARDEIRALKDRAVHSDDMSKVYPHVFTCKGTISGHTGPIWAIAVAVVSNNTVLISGSSDSTVKVWDATTFQGLYSLQKHEGIIHALAVCGRFLFSGSSDSTINVWDMQAEMEHLQTVQAHDNTVCTLAAAEDRGLLFSGSLKVIKVWNVNEKDEKGVLTCSHTLTGHNHWVRALAVSKERLYSGSYNMIKVWDLTHAETICIQTINGHDGSVYSLAVAGPYLFSGTYENTVQVWDLKTLACHQTLTGHLGTVYSVCVSNGRLFSGSYDSTIKVWDLESMHCVQTMVRHTSSVDAVVFAKGRLFTGSADNTIKIWQ